jgi:hypothetical protein
MHRGLVRGSLGNTSAHTYMNIQILANNLRETIVNKQRYLTTYKSPTDKPDVLSQHLEINIAELKRWLKDVEQCELKNEETSNRW